MKDLTFRQKVIQGIHDLFYIWKREFGTTFRDQGVLIFFVLEIGRASCRERV